MDNDTLKLYQLTDKEKAELVDKVSQDITFETESDEFENETDDLDEVG